MIAELGHFALILALAVAAVQSVVPLVGAERGWTDWMRLSGSAALIQFLLVGLSFWALMHAFLTSDFSVALVANHSNSAMPVVFKLTATWGNHEGSMLLWVLILSLFGAMVAAFGRDLPLPLKARALAVQAMIGVAFFTFILFTSNPFERLANPPADGADLNPLLQDIGLAIHPPFLYIGYVGLSMAYSFAVAALIEGRVDAGWARWVRPWTLAAWIALTIGIALGSYWAYYELGWGGWWFWDPVENASFMPWLIAAALLHSAIVVEKRSALKSWTILLAILAFSLSLLGTFIVRSGVITSVHAFANDPERGIYILSILVISIAVPLTLFVMRGAAMKSEGVFQAVSREGALILNNLALAVACAVVFVGTLMPVLFDILRDFAGLAMPKLSVGAPFYDLAFTPFMVVLFAAVPMGSLIAWKRGDGLRVVRRLRLAALAALAVGAAVWIFGPGQSAAGPRTITDPQLLFVLLTVAILFLLGTILVWGWISESAATKTYWFAAFVLALGVAIGAWYAGLSLLAPIGLALAAWLVLGSVVELLERAGFGRVGLAKGLGRLAGLPRADWGKLTAHAGLGLTAMGIAAVSAWEIEEIRMARPGDVIPIGPYEVAFDSVEQLPLGAPFDALTCGGTADRIVKAGEPRNFSTIYARLRLLRDGELLTHMCPEKRLYPVQRMPSTEAAIDPGLTRDVYLVLGDPGADGAWAVRAYYKPLANWIWIGSLIMAFGGMVSLTDRRYRVGAARRRAAAVPAE